MLGGKGTAESGNGSLPMGRDFFYQDLEQKGGSKTRRGEISGSRALCTHFRKKGRFGGGCCSSGGGQNGSGVIRGGTIFPQRGSDRE